MEISKEKKPTKKTKNNRLYVVLIALFYPAILGAVIYDVFKFIFGLFKDHGVLGIIPEIVRHPALLTGLHAQALILVAALILLYIMDFAYTIVEVDEEEVGESGKDEYHTVQFCCDTIIIISLFIATQLVFSAIPVFNHHENAWESFTDGRWILFFLFITKLCSVYWELPDDEWKSPHWRDVLELLVHNRANSKKAGELILGHYEWLSDGLLGVIYFIVLLIGIVGSHSAWLDGNHSWFVSILVFLVLFDVWTYYKHSKMEKAIAGIST